MDSVTSEINLLINIILTAWNNQNNYLNKLVASLPDEQLAKEIASGKNTGIYLLGHLVAVSDAMLPLLGFGERMFPHLDNLFIKNPDKSGLDKPAIGELKENLQAVNARLNSHLQSTPVEEWFSGHTAVSAEDFAREPHRNKLNVIISRTSHMANHIGQLLLLK